MSESARTGIHAAIAAVLALLVVATRPALPTAKAYDDQGKAFYADFTDPLLAASLEVADWDEASARGRNFKVELKDGKYVIPSKFNHPADAKDRLAKTAAAMIGLTKEAVRSDNPKDHEAYGVVDPTEPGAGGAGKGARVILRDASGKALSDLIFGKAVKEKSGFRYVRVPQQRRVYEAKVPYEISSKFSDWVETDLLQVQVAQLNKVELETYTIDERAQRIKDPQTNVLTKDASGTWVLDTLAAGEELKKEAADEIVSALDELKIVDVRSKPESLSKYFKGEAKSVNIEDLGDLQERGFYVSQGRIYANEGELAAHTDDGVRYRIWFGEVVSDADEGKELGKESRYLLIRTYFDEAAFPAPEAPKDVKADGTPKTDEEKKKDQDEYDFKKREHAARIDNGRIREQALARRFGDWYYVVTDESYKKLRKTKADLIKPPEEKKPDEKPK